MSARKCRLLGAGTLALALTAATAAPAWAASTWTVPISGSSSGEAHAGTISEKVNSSCTATATGTSCGTSNILPNAGGSSSVSITNNGNAPSNYDLTATGCGAATPSDYESTTTVAHGSFTPSSYQASGPKSGYSMQFDGSSTWLGAEGGGAVAGPQTFTELAWFKTGVASYDEGIMSFQTTQNPGSGPPSGHWDRDLWVNPNGQVSAAVNPTGSSPVTISSTQGSPSYSDNAWHLAAFTDSASGIYLYVDGTQVASNTSTSGAQSMSGWWSVGMAQLNTIGYSGWTVNGGEGFFNGYLAGAAVLSTALSLSQIQSLYNSASFSAYTTSVESYSLLHYWSLQDAAPTGSTASTATLPGQVSAFPDTAGDVPVDDATASGGVTSSSSGPLNGAAAYFNGSTGYLQTANAWNPQTFTEVAWFKSSSSSGGTILGMSDVQGNSGQYYKDRILWLDNSGKVVFGVYPGATDEVTSGSSYNNGQWHFVVASIGSSGQQLWVDNSEVASNGSVTSAQSYNGYWHIGWNSEASWPDAPTSSYFNGSLAGVGVLPSQLSSSQINTLYTSSNITTYGTNVKADSPSAYWALQYAAGNYPDLSGSANNATAYGGVTSSASGPLSSGASASFDGSTGYVQTTTSNNWQTFTAAAWFKTSNGYGSGGAILGMADAQGNTGLLDWDRIIWMDNSGKIVFGVNPGAFQMLTSSSSYNDGNWHFVVAELGSSGMQLYVDGTRVGYNASVTSAQNFSGYWHIGWDSLVNWTDPPTSYYLNGSIAGAAIFTTQLSSTLVSALYNASNFSNYSGTVINDGATAYWPLTAQPNACSAALVTVSITTGGTTTCVLPPKTSGTACPSASSGGLPLTDLTTAVMPTTVTVAANGTATLNLNVADNGSLASALSATDVQADATVSAADNAWQAGAVYSNSLSQL